MNENFFYNMLSGIKVMPGVKTVAYITITQQIVTEGFRAMDKASRKCNFGHEEPRAYFLNYTRESCQYICSLNYRLRKFGCIPWDVPPVTPAGWPHHDQAPVS